MPTVLRQYLAADLPFEAATYCRCRARWRQTAASFVSFGT